MGGDIGKAFERLVKEVFIIHGGLRFERTPAGFVHNGIICRNWEEMDILVEQEKRALTMSINCLKNE